MLSAIVTSLDEDNLLATPSGNIDVKAFIGKKARYMDKSNRCWPAVVTGADDPYVIIKFDKFPSGIGQGQIVDLMEDGDDEAAFLRGE